MKIAFDSPPCLVSSGDDPGPGGFQLGAAFGIRDRHRHKLGEGSQACLGVPREGLLDARAGSHHSPEPALDDDRAPNRGTDARVLGDHAERTGSTGVVVDPHGTARLEYECGEVVSPKRPPAATAETLVALGPGGDERHRVAGLVAAHVRHVGRKQPPDLLGDCCEHLL